MSFCWSSRDRAHIADHTHDLDRHAATGHEQRLADRIFVAEDGLRAGCANQDDIWMIGHVLLVEIAPGEKWDAQGANPSRRNVI